MYDSIWITTVSDTPFPYSVIHQQPCSSFMTGGVDFLHPPLRTQSSVHIVHLPWASVTAWEQTTGWVAPISSDCVPNMMSQTQPTCSLKRIHPRSWAKSTVAKTQPTTEWKELENKCLLFWVMQFFDRWLRSIIMAIFDEEWHKAISSQWHFLNDFLYL